jgi:alpha-N-arabinofuranosidase
VKGSKKKIDISFDEWNVWYIDRYHGVDKIEGIDNWPVAPRLLEDIYSVADAVVFGNLMISLLKHADRVTSASLAQLVNVIAPIMTAPDGPAWRQTIFYPFMFASRFGRGTALDLKVDGPTYPTKIAGDVSSLDVSAVHDERTGHVSFFIVNRSDKPVEAEFDLTGFGGKPEIVDFQVMTHADLKAVNNEKNMTEVAPKNGDGATISGGRLSAKFAAYSYQMIRVKA